MHCVGWGVALDRAEDGERLAEVLEEQFVDLFALVEEHVHDARPNRVRRDLHREKRMEKF